VLLPGAALVEITDISKLKLTVKVPEKEVVKYKEGGQISLQADVYPGASFEGKITLVGVKADATHNYPVEILVANQKEQPLRAGMYGRASTGVALKDSALTIPRAALLGSVKNPRVYVVENNKAVLKDISVGADTQGLVEVLAGLQEGEKVVVSGQINLEDKSQINIVQ
jgi:RND family efflux transporter MFP subunit